MHDGIKSKVLETLEVVILFWRGRVTADLKQEKDKKRTFQEMERKLQVLIGLVFEVCVAIGDAMFLWTQVYQMFKQIGYHKMFNAESEGWILSGAFVEWPAPEDTLNFNVL
jgi:precorrin isomerase